MASSASREELTFEELVLIAGGHTAFQLLWAGVTLGLFSLLSKSPGATSDDIATKLGLEQQPTRILLVGLTALKLIKKEGDAYRNAHLTEQMLIPEKAGSAAPILGWQAHIVYPGLINFIESLKSGKNTGLEYLPGAGNTLYERLVSHPKVETVFQEAMSALSSQANNYMLQTVDLTNVVHLVDAGGGDGTNAIAFAKKYPELKITIFDSPSVCEIARKKIDQVGLSERIDTWEGNFLSDPFPDGIDAVIYAHIFTIWSPENNLRLLHRTYSALNEGGRVLIFNMMANDDDTGPLSTALGSPYFLAIATGEGMLYSWKDYEKWLAEAGFAKTQRVGDLPLNHGLIVGQK